MDKKDKKKEALWKFVFDTNEKWSWKIFPCKLRIEKKNFGKLNCYTYEYDCVYTYDTRQKL